MATSTFEEMWMTTRISGNMRMATSTLERMGMVMFTLDEMGMPTSTLVHLHLGKDMDDHIRLGWPPLTSEEMGDGHLQLGKAVDGVMGMATSTLEKIGMTTCT